MRSRIAEPDDLLGYTKKSSAIYRGVLNLLGYAAKGLRDWSNTQSLDMSMQLEDHHIFPRAYVLSSPKLDIDQAEAEQLVDCVVNRTLIPKITNIRVGKKAPSIYLSELQKKNAELPGCLSSHLVAPRMISDVLRDRAFSAFLDERAKAIFQLIERYAITPWSEMVVRHGTQSDGKLPISPVDKSPTTPVAPTVSRPRLKDLFAEGLLKPGDTVFTRKKPEILATVVDADNVEYNGDRMSFNAWGQLVTGWSSINVYESVILARIGLPLGSLRDSRTSAGTEGVTATPERAAQPEIASVGATRRR